MKFIVKLYPEIMMKSKPVRMRFTKMLETNIRNVLKKLMKMLKCNVNGTVFG